MQIVNTPPRTIMEVFKMLPEGTLAELINGTLYMSPSPTTEHQRILLKIAFDLMSFTKKEKTGEVMLAPYDVYLDEHSNAVQPDIIFVATTNNQIIREDAIHGVPDLLIEILSKGNSDHDLIRKKDLYEKFGVKEYWIVNPDSKETIGYKLDKGKYTEQGRHSGKIVFALLNKEVQF